MPSLKDIKTRIQSVRSTQQTTKAMKMVSASKLRRAQDLIVQLRPYANKLQDLLHHLSGAGENPSPYSEVREVRQVLVVVITSNRGLCGAFNNSIIRIAQRLIDHQYEAFRREGHLRMICLGRKGFEYFVKRGYPVMGDNHDVFHRLSFEGVTEVTTRIMDGYLNGEWDRVEVVYNQFKNVATQIRKTDQFLPVSIHADQEDPNQPPGADYIFEPNQEAIIEELIPIILKTQFYRMVLDSNASEHGARMVAMDKATDNAEELIKDLRLQYNKARQASITKEILEIVGGAEALSSGN